MRWSNMSEAERDDFLAEWVLTGYENGAGRAEFSWALSAVQKVFPRLRLKACWRVLDAWQCMVPIKQAPAAPPELLQAMMAMAVMLNRPQLGMVFLLAYTGLLRIREALSLRVKDVILHPKSVTLCLAVTKRGMEQKVVLTNPSVVVWATEFFNRFPRSKQQQQLFAISYNSALRWVKKLAMLLGAESLNLTTHTFRRSGASELARLGMPLADILLYGRWHSERAAREYIRRGEVAVLRSRGLISAQDWIRIDAWADLCPRVWKIYDGTFAKTSVPVRPNVVTPDKLNSIERLLFFQRCC